MDISPEVLAAARKLKSRAVAQILEQAYPEVYRIAMALAGREDVGRGIVRFVMARSVRVMPGWSEELDPTQWFWRYTILTSRRAAKHQPDPRNDLLLDSDPPDPEYLAFIAALRKLPHQQQEAFLLEYGEHAATRAAATAMDCSTLAAMNHLTAATDSLMLVAGNHFEALTARLAKRYAQLAPDENLILPRVQQIIRRHVWPRRMLNLSMGLLLMAIFIALAFAARWLLRVLEI